MSNTNNFKVIENALNMASEKQLRTVYQVALIALADIMEDAATREDAAGADSEPVDTSFSFSPIGPLLESPPCQGLTPSKFSSIVASLKPEQKDATMQHPDPKDETCCGTETAKTDAPAEAPKEDETKKEEAGQ